MCDREAALPVDPAHERETQSLDASRPERTVKQNTAGEACTPVDYSEWQRREGQPGTAGLIGLQSRDAAHRIARSGLFHADVEGREAIATSGDPPVHAQH